MSGESDPWEVMLSKAFRNAFEGAVREGDWIGLVWLRKHLIMWADAAEDALEEVADRALEEVADRHE